MTCHSRIWGIKLVEDVGGVHHGKARKERRNHNSSPRVKRLQMHQLVRRMLESQEQTTVAEDEVATVASIPTLVN